MELWTGMLEYIMNQIAHAQYDLIHEEWVDRKYGSRTTDQQMHEFD